MADERKREPGMLTIARIQGGDRNDDKKFSIQFENGKYRTVAEFWCNGQTLAEALTSYGSRPGEVWVKPNEGSDGENAEKYRRALLAIQECLLPYGKDMTRLTHAEEVLLTLIEDALE